MRELAGEKLKITPDARNAVKKFLATPQSISLLLATTASSSGYSSISWILVNSCYSSTASTLAVISTTRTNWAASEFFRQFVKWCVKYTWAIADWCAYHELITENQTYCACAGEDDWGRGEAAVFFETRDCHRRFMTRGIAVTMNEWPVLSRVANCTINLVVDTDTVIRYKQNWISSVYFITANQRGRHSLVFFLIVIPNLHAPPPRVTSSDLCKDVFVFSFYARQHML